MIKKYNLYRVPSSSAVSMILQSEISCKSMTCCGSGAVADFFGHSEPIAAPALVNGEVMDLETASATLPVL